VLVDLIDQQDVHKAACGLSSFKPGRQHLRIIDDEHVPIAQIFYDVLEGAVLQIAILPVQDEQAGTRPIRLWMLGYELLWQGIIELFCLQAHKSKLIL
jgi:hypothetical protein